MRKDVFDKPKIIEGRAWFIPKDHIDTSMIYSEKYLPINDFIDIGQYTFKELPGFENFAQQALPGDILIAGKDFGCGTFYQHAIDCFISIGVQAIIAKSFCEFYKSKSINAGFPVMTYQNIENIKLEQWDKIRVNFIKSTITNLRNNKTIQINPFSDQQLETYLQGGNV